MTTTPASKVIDIRFAVRTANGEYLGSGGNNRGSFRDLSTAQRIRKYRGGAGAVIVVTQEVEIQELAL